MKKAIIFGLLASAALAVFLSPFASQSPDGLEKVAQDMGFLSEGEGKNVFSAPLPDYTVPGIAHEGVTVSLAGFSGVILVFALAAGAGYLLKRKL